jgi:DNA-binding winged helix-turn-helix (wHTH) protein/tetratricopeptide (TPR) repeat protein
MATRLFRFGRFRLYPQARELFDGEQRLDLPLSTIDCLIYLIQHRDRPVGRDELAAAVWGRADVSEVSLSHAVMRLRRLLGDTGNEQRVIRTVPRLGYRWVMEGTADDEGVEERVAAPVLDESAELVEPVPVAAPRARRRILIAAFASAAIAIAAVAAVVLLRSAKGDISADATPTPAMVLPVAVDAPPESVWVRLGLMDLVATQLRRGGIATAPSETVVALVKARGDATPFDAAAFPNSMIVQPAATFARGTWTMRLDAHDAQRRVRVETHADDPIQAGRSAADELLIKLGRTPPADEAGDLSLAQQTLRQRVNAALLSGQIDVARNLIHAASPDLQRTPEIAFSQAKLEFFTGNYERSRQEIEALLGALPADAPAELRARAWNTLGASHFRQGRLDEAGKAYAEAVRLIENGNAPEVLANSYLGIGGVASQHLKLEDAAASYGRARTLFELGNDAFGVAAVDLNLGMNAMQRGQPAAALPILRGAAERFTTFAAEDALAATYVAIIEADLALLDTKDALATSVRFAPIESHAGNQRLRWQLMLARAGALVGAGMLGDADALLARIADSSDPKQDEMLRAQANGLAAEIAIARGDCERGADFAGAGLVPVLESANAAAYAKVWRNVVRGLQCSHQIAAAAEQIARLRTWSESTGDDGVRVELLIAEADQASAEGAHEDALGRYAEAMTLATRRAIPDEMVAVGLPYVRSLLRAGRVNEAVSVNGRIAAWADRDARAATAEALVYRALNKSAAADSALGRARRLAGERALPELVADDDRAAVR